MVTTVIDMSAGISITQTDDIKVMIDDVMTANGPIVAKILKGQPENAMILRELMINIYIRGFFCGVHHRNNDPDIR